MRAYDTEKKWWSSEGSDLQFSPSWLPAQGIHKTLLLENKFIIWKFRQVELVSVTWHQKNPTAIGRGFFEILLRKTIKIVFYFLKCLEEVIYISVEGIFVCEYNSL